MFYDRGGVYSDLDIVCVTSIYSRIDTDEFNQVYLIISPESDTSVKKETRWCDEYARESQICWWTIASAPKHSILAEIINIILRQPKRHSFGASVM